MVKHISKKTFHKSYNKTLFSEKRNDNDRKFIINIKDLDVGFMAS